MHYPIEMQATMAAAVGSGPPCGTFEEETPVTCYEAHSLSIICFPEVKCIVDDCKSKTLILDVRTAEEYDCGHIPRAKNIPVEELREAMKLSCEEFEKKYCFPKPEKTQCIVTYCATGKRAQRAFTILKCIGFKNLKVYKAGWPDWKEKGGKIEGGKEEEEKKCEACGAALMADLREKALPCRRSVPMDQLTSSVWQSVDCPRHGRQLARKSCPHRATPPSRCHHGRG